jgi:hypothetical protein
VTKTEARDAITLVLWAAGRPAHYGPVADVVAGQAARRLEARARKALAADTLTRREVTR